MERWIVSIVLLLLCSICLPAQSTGQAHTIVVRQFWMKMIEEPSILGMPFLIRTGTRKQRDSMKRQRS